MSSSKFEVTLHPDAGLHRRIAGIGLAALALGGVLICLLPVSRGLRILSLISWLLISAIELRCWWTSIRSLAAMRFMAGGEIHCLFENGIWRQFEILPGSRVMSHQVWLRLGGTGGMVRGVLLTSATTGVDEWRRLQVMLRNSH